MSSYKPVTNVLDFNVALKPSKAFPLDPRTMFGSYEDAMAAAATAEDAGSDKTIYYFGQTVTVYEEGVAKSYLIQPDDSGKGTLVEQSAVASWNDLTDKPFGEEVYEDSYDFAVTPTVYFDAMGNRFYKISDIALSYEQLLQTSFTLVSGETSETTTPTADSFVFNNEEVSGFISGDITIGVAYTTGEIVTDFGTLNVPEIGTYIGFPEASVPSAGTVASFRYEGVKTLDPKYLPEMDTLPEVTEEDNGKILSVENGEWTAKEPQEEEAELPTVTEEDDGKHLVVSGGKWTAQEQKETTELPTVTEADNGKFLQVVDGAWSAVTITDGNEVAW